MWGGVSVILCETFIPALPLLQFSRIMSVYVGRSECDPVWDLYSRAALVTVLQDHVCVCGEEWVWSCVRPLFPLCPCYSSPGSCLCMWGGVSVILCETFIPALPLLQFSRILSVYVGRSECDPVWDLYSRSALVTVLQDPVCVCGEEWVWSCVRPLFPLCPCYSSPGSCLCMWGGVSVILCETFIPTLPLLQFSRSLSDCVCGEEWVWSCVRPLFPLCPCYSSPGSCLTVCGEEWVWSCVRPLFPLCPCYSSPGSCLSLWRGWVLSCVRPYLFQFCPLCSSPGSCQTVYMGRVGVILCETIFIPVLPSLQFSRILSDCVYGEGGCYPVWDHLYSSSALSAVLQDPVRLCIWGGWVLSCVRPSLFQFCPLCSSPGSCQIVYMGRVGVILCETIFIPVLPSLQFSRILSDCVYGEGGCYPVWDHLYSSSALSAVLQDPVRLCIWGGWVLSCVRPYLFQFCPLCSSPGSCQTVYMGRVGVILCETIFIPVLPSLQFPRILSDCVCGEGGCYPAWDHIYSHPAVDTVPLDPVRLCVWGAGPGQPRRVPRSLQACGHCQPQERVRSPGQVSAASLPECLYGVFTQSVCTVSWGGGGGGGCFLLFLLYTEGFPGMGSYHQFCVSICMCTLCTLLTGH